jgi:hypothetical protein
VPVGQQVSGVRGVKCASGTAGERCERCEMCQCQWISSPSACNAFLAASYILAPRDVSGCWSGASGAFTEIAVINHGLLQAGRWIQ